MWLKTLSHLGAFHAGSYVLFRRRSGWPELALCGVHIKFRIISICIQWQPLEE